METDKLKSLLGEMTSDPERQYDCPEDELLAVYMDGGLSEVSHREFEDHLADCAWCLERVGIMGRAHESETQGQVSELLLARAGNIVDSPRQPMSRWRRAPAWAAAAVLVLTFGFLASNTTFHGSVPQPESRGDADTAQSTRSVDPAGMQSAQRLTANNISVELSDGVFSWTPVNDSQFYQVRIVTAEGDLLWQERVHDEHWKAPEGLVFSPGEEYFVRIDAFLSENLSVNSDYVAFRTPERR
jgi:hypothetical protein